MLSGAVLAGSAINAGVDAVACSGIVRTGATVTITRGCGCGVMRLIASESFFGFVEEVRHD